MAAILTVVAMGVLTYKGATARGIDRLRAPRSRADWAEQQGFAGNADAVEGAEIFAKAGCANCHTYLGAGTANVGAPDPSNIGAQRPERGLLRPLRRQPAEFGNTVMRRSSSSARRTKLAAFLVASKGSQ